MNEQKQTETTDSPSWWKSLRPHLGGLVAFWTLIFTLLVFTAPKVIEIYHQVTWKEEVLVISFVSTGRQAFLNSGDGEVFLSHVDIESEFGSEPVPINSIIKPKQFLSLPKQANFDFDQAKPISEDLSDDDWKQVLSKPRLDKSYRWVFLFEDDPLLQLFKKQYGARFKSFPASAQLIYYSAKDGRRFSEELPVEGIVMQLSPEPKAEKK